MELIRRAADAVLHMDRHLGDWVDKFGPWAYAILFLIVFCETGLVVTPILPGDSLLFAAGALAALGGAGNHPLNVWALGPLLAAACLCGDLVNYSVGRFLGARLFRNPNARFLKRSHL